VTENVGYGDVFFSILSELWPVVRNLIGVFEITLVFHHAHENGGYALPRTKDI
jgi:nitrate reductase NapAB chaperone NapD